MADRYVVTMASGDTIITYDGKQPDKLSAILACVRMSGADAAPTGIYGVEVGTYGCEPVTRRVGVRADGSVDALSRGEG